MAELSFRHRLSRGSVGRWLAIAVLVAIHLGVLLFAIDSRTDPAQASEPAPAQSGAGRSDPPRTGPHESKVQSPRSKVTDGAGRSEPPSTGPLPGVPRPAAAPPSALAGVAAPAPGALVPAAGLTDQAGAQAITMSRVFLPLVTRESPQPVRGDGRFGLLFCTGPTPDRVEDLTARLNTPWYASGPNAPGQIPAGRQTPQSVMFTRWPTPLDQVAARAKALPGSAWLISNEPNVNEQDGTSPEEAALLFHEYARVIKAADPSATLVGPNILNWEFTCIGCPGFRSGRAWVDGFRSAYRQRYGIEPPIDVWGIHAYDLDWEHLPTVNWQRTTEQLRDLRAYLDAIPEHRGKPIWLTEAALHWGYSGLEWKQDAAGKWKAYPIGPYQTAQVEDFVRQLFGWLKQEGPRHGIARWFLYCDVGHLEDWSIVRSGINLVERPERGAPLTSFGEIYRDLAALPAR